MMNYIRHLNAFFFQHVKRDKRLTANHVSLYLALFQFWNYNRFQNPFPVSREGVMGITGIGSKNTYHKCLKDLHDFGYVYYKRSAGKFQKSQVHLVRLDIQKKEEELKQLDLFEGKNFCQDLPEENAVTVPNPVQQNPDSNVPDLIPAQSHICDRPGPTFDTGTVPNLGLVIKYKLLNERKGEKTLPPSGKNFLKNGQGENAVSTRPAEKKYARPEITRVLSFFTKNNYPDLEAKKFFNHYQSNGWLVGGISPMTDWQSSAHKWMLNAEKFKSRTNQKNPNKSAADYRIDKDFSEPL
jgi:hypothetical protein